LKKNGLDPTSAAVISVGLGATAVAAIGARPDRCRRDARTRRSPCCKGQPQGPHHFSPIPARKRNTLALFGGEYPGRAALYSTAAWVGSHEKGRGRP